MNRIVVIGSCNMDIVVLADKRPTAGETIMGNELHIAHGGKDFERFGEMGGLKNDVAHGGQAAPCWQCCRPGLLALWLACTVSNVAVHRMGALSDYALGVVPKLFNLGSYPSDKKSLQLP